ncbi:hypothetical protein ACOME3_010389 [Neoechinorhynchus agilis]
MISNKLTDKYRLLFGYPKRRTTQERTPQTAEFCAKLIHQFWNKEVFLIWNRASCEDNSSTRSYSTESCG